MIMLLLCVLCFELALSAPDDILQWHASFVSSEDWYNIGITKGVVAADGKDMIWHGSNGDSYVQVCSEDHSSYGSFNSSSCAGLECLDGKGCNGIRACACRNSCGSGAILCALSSSVESGPCTVGAQSGILWNVIESVFVCMSQDGKTALGIVVYKTVTVVEFSNFTLGLPTPSPFQIPCKCSKK